MQTKPTCNKDFRDMLIMISGQQDYSQCRPHAIYPIDHNPRHLQDSIRILHEMESSKHQTILSDDSVRKLIFRVHNLHRVTMWTLHKAFLYLYRNQDDIP